MDPREALEYIVASRPLALVTDFDGTLSKIAPTPEQAVVYPRCRQLLAHLSDLLPLVAVLSGRPAADVRMLLGLEEIPRPDDAADAVAVAICFLHGARFQALVDQEDNR